MNKKKIYIIISIIAFVLLLLVYFGKYYNWNLGDGYYKKNSRIYYLDVNDNKKLVTDIPNEFELLGDGFAKTKFSFVYKGRIVSLHNSYGKKISDNIFVTENELFYFNDNNIDKVKDNNYTYYVDGRTMKEIKKNYLQDSNYYYYVKDKNNYRFKCKNFEVIEGKEEYDVVCDNDLLLKGKKINQNTYINPDLDFKFNYPNDWKVKDIENGTFCVKNEKRGDMLVEDLEKSLCDLIIKKYKKISELNNYKNNETLEEWINNNFLDDSFEKNKLKINNVDAFSLKSKKIDVENKEEIYFMKENTVYQINRNLKKDEYTDVNVNNLVFNSIKFNLKDNAKEKGIESEMKKINYVKPTETNRDKQEEKYNKLFSLENECNKLRLDLKNAISMKVYIYEESVYLQKNGEEKVIAKNFHDESKPGSIRKYDSVSISPNGLYVAMRATGWEGVYIEIYDIENEKIYITSNSGNGYCWLENDKLKVVGGCGMGIDCGVFESIDINMPWILEEVDFMVE